MSSKPKARRNWLCIIKFCAYHECNIVRQADEDVQLVLFSLLVMSNVSTALKEEEKI